MTSKKSLDDMYNIAISNSDYEKADKVRECYNAIADDLEILEILKENANLYVSEFNKEVKYIQISITTCDKRFEKVEGWLNEK